MADKPDSSSRNRMLLSHNFALANDEVHPLNREEFAEVFIKGLKEQSGLEPAMIENPHWIVAVHYDASQYKPSQVGQLCAETLATYRKTHKKEGFYVMALGGVKTTPPTGDKPSLQTGEWGVDVVETVDPEAFLEEISWDKLAGAKPPENVFRIDHAV